MILEWEELSVKGSAGLYKDMRLQTTHTAGA